MSQRSLEELVANSNLTATAMEFIPQSSNTSNSSFTNSKSVQSAGSQREPLGNSNVSDKRTESKLNNLHSWRSNGSNMEARTDRRNNGYQQWSRNGHHSGRPKSNKAHSNYVKTSENSESSKKVGATYLTNNASSVEKNKNQMEVLVVQLTRGTLECLVCCERVRQQQSIWSCRVCHHVLHLRCITKWAVSSKAAGGWRCPACQHVSTKIPTEYSCFCGKVADPDWRASDCPHSCGGVCGNSRPHPCIHRCTLPCHPGPCPPCLLYVNRDCCCGRTSRTVPCTDPEVILCEQPCRRLLNCGVHTCSELCHSGSCPPCSVLVNQECFCGNSRREVACSQSSVGVFSYCCGDPCNKNLECGNHKCNLLCHEGSCPKCPLLPESVACCPCGKTQLTDLPADTRLTCLDPIPLCDKPCGKLLACGEIDNLHECPHACHDGECPPCQKETTVRCRCGHVTKTLACAQLTALTDGVRCDRKCNKKRSCGKHRCREVCCVDSNHICPLPCSRTLSCGIHKCEELCHSAYCRPCTRDSYSELFCECGAECIFPPIPCGTRPPSCGRPCSRQHDCIHPSTHTCHSDAQCPPCTVLVSKQCHGGHELRKAVACHLDSFSCGIPCGKPLSCGRHTCTTPCHAGPCLKDDQICIQPCAVARPICGHPCGLPCHEPPCPDTPCKHVVKVTCMCGLRFSTRSCVDNAQEYQRIAVAQLASKMADLAAGQSVDLSEVAGRKISFKTLECNDECKMVERSRRLAIGLQIRNPDLSGKLTPRYSDFLKGWAKKDPRFCQMVHDKLTDLVQRAKQSKQKSRSHSFDAMNRDKRQFLHEMCEHFGCESVAYDHEPNRNIVATALRDKSWLPSVSLLELIERENGSRRVPLPSNSTSKMSTYNKGMEVLPARAPAASAWALPTTATSSRSTDSANGK